jgi:hypothetical protein
MRFSNGAHPCAPAALAAILLTALAGCTSIDVQNGELGNGGFKYLCDSSTPKCQADGTAQVFPDAIASGARFNLRFERNGGKASVEALRPVAKDIINTIDTDPPSFVAIKPGWGGFVARNASGELVDFSMTRIVRAARIKLPTSADTDTFKLSLPYSGARATLRPVLVSSGDLQLAGDVAFEWTSVDPSIAALEEKDRGRWDVVARSRGTTRLKVEGAGLSREIDVEVTGP